MPDPTHITVAGVEVDFPTLDNSQIKQFIALLLPILHASRLDDNGAWLQTLHDNAMELAQAVAMATSRPIEWVVGLPFDEFMDLARSVLDAYQAHFSQAIEPAADGEM